MQRIAGHGFTLLAGICALAHASQRDNIYETLASIAPCHGEPL